MCARRTDKSAFPPDLRVGPLHSSHRLWCLRGCWGQSFLQRILLGSARSFKKDNLQIPSNNLVEIIHPFEVPKSMVSHIFRVVQPSHRPIPQYRYRLREEITPISKCVSLSPPQTRNTLPPPSPGQPLIYLLSVDLPVPGIPSM